MHETNWTGFDGRVQNNQQSHRIDVEEGSATSLVGKMLQANKLACSCLTKTLAMPWKVVVMISVQS